MDHVRIDEGIKRPKRKRDPVNGRILPAVTPEVRTEILDQAIQAIAHGQSAMIVAGAHNIDYSTLYKWILADCKPEADTARRNHFAGELVRALEAIKGASDPFLLARAREDYRATAWLAERRCSGQYGQHSTQVVITADLESAIDRARERAERVVLGVDSDQKLINPLEST